MDLAASHKRPPSSFLQSFPSREICTHKVYTSRSLPCFLQPVDSHEIFPQRFRKCQKTLANSLGTCPTTVQSAFSRATAVCREIFSFLANQKNFSNHGVQMFLKTWWPWITLTFNRMEPSGSLPMLVILSSLRVHSTYTLHSHMHHNCIVGVL